MNEIMNGLKFYVIYPRLITALLTSALCSVTAVQAMPGATAADDAAVATASASPAELSQAAQFAPLYRQNCSACHGDKGDGKSRAQNGLRPPPRNFTTAAAWQELSRERMITSVTFGRPGTAMVGWQGRLSEAQIAGVVDYVRETFMREPPLINTALKNKASKDAPPAKVALVDDVPTHAVASTSNVALFRSGRTGREIYKRHCSACHGDKGNGSTWTKTGLNPPPRDFTTAEAKEYLSRERMITSVTYGRTGTAMMPFSARLSSTEIETVVDYIRGGFMRVAGVAVPADTDIADAATNPHAAAPHVRNHPGADATAGAMPLAPNQPQPPASHQLSRPSLVESDMTLQLPHGLVGDVAAGREFFMNNCFTCHGVRGDGNGPRSSFITPRPRNFLGERARKTLNRPALFRAISMGLPGTVMPAWGKVLDNQQIADVTEFVFQTFIQQKKKVTTSSELTTE